MGTSDSGIAVSAVSSARWEFWSRIRPMFGYPIVPLLITAMFVVFAIAGPQIAPRDPEDTQLMDRLKPPAWEATGSSQYLLGTDHLGRDLLSRLIVGARVSLIVAALGVLAGAAVGVLLGLLSGYMGGTLDTVIMRVADGALSFPILLFALLLAVIIGPGVVTVVLAATVFLWARFARVIRSEVLSIKESNFVRLAKLAPCSNTRIMLVHILPNVLNTAVVMTTLHVGFVITLEASLSFLGAGVPPPTPTWGGMVADGRLHMTSAWWYPLFPAMAIVLLVVSLNMVGDWLRDYLDPKLQQV